MSPAAEAVAFAAAFAELFLIFCVSDAAVFLHNNWQMNQFYKSHYLMISIRQDQTRF